MTTLRHNHSPDGASPSLREAVEAVLLATAPGDVVTYGEVAAEAGFPGAARAVGRLLARSDGQWPWWRVVNASGRLVPGHEAEHGQRLAGEGVAVVNGRVAINRDRRMRDLPPPSGRLAQPAPRRR